MLTSYPELQVNAANGGFSIQQPIVTNPENGITSGGNILKAGQQGVTLGNVGVGDSIQVSPSGCPASCSLLPELHAERPASVRGAAVKGSGAI